MTRKFVSVLVFVFVCAGGVVLASAQQCPTLSVYGPSSDMNIGDTVKFTLMISGGDPKVTPKIEWSASTGKIVKGQGGDEIDVDSTGMFENTITARASVKGYAESCNAVASTSAFFAKRPESRKTDELGVMKPADEQARLDNFAVELQNDPTANGYVIVYAGKKSKAGDTKATMARIRNYLVDKRGIDESRITVTDGGTRLAAAIELWITPTGAAAPKPKPEN